MQLGSKQACHAYTQWGFTLIELCICLVVIGFLMIPVAETYRNSLFITKQEKTRDNITESSSEITSHFSLGRLPCPSNRALAPGAANYGRELGIAGDPTVADINAIPLCTGGMQGICRTAGARDTDADADITADPILIGGVPVTSIQESSGSLAAEKALDAWGNQLTYAVSARLCQFPADETNRVSAHKRGVIQAVDEFGQPTAGIGTRDLSEPPNLTRDPDGQFVVLSHGETGAGAYSASGAPVAACNLGNRDSENCDNDFTFMSSLGNYRSNTANFFDDLVYFQLYIPNDLWDSMSVIDAAGNVQTTRDIRNLNSNNVGVLTDAPQAKLHVDGNVQAATTRSPEYCDLTAPTPVCFEYDFLLDPQDDPTELKRNTCGDGEVIITLADNKVTCGKVNIQAPIADQNCAIIDPTKPYLRGILSNGTPICTN